MFPISRSFERRMEQESELLLLEQPCTMSWLLMTVRECLE